MMTRSLQTISDRFPGRIIQHQLDESLRWLRQLTDCIEPQRQWDRPVAPAAWTEERLAELDQIAFTATRLAKQLRNADAATDDE